MATNTNKLITLTWIQDYHSRLMEFINSKNSSIKKWEPNYKYFKDELVIYNNSIYCADRNNQSAVFNISDWTNISGVDIGADIDFATWS